MQVTARLSGDRLLKVRFDSYFACGNVYVCRGTNGYSNVQTYCFNVTTRVPIWSTPSKASGDEGIGDWTCSVAVVDGSVYVGMPGARHFGYMNFMVWMPLQ
jgi:outer membrane protein assembly factor BamB